MTFPIRSLLALEASAFAGASLIHAGLLLPGHEHARAATAEGVIAAVLLAGLAIALARPRQSRAAGLWAQGFALLGTVTGVVAIALGVGPRTAPDLVFHAGVLALLAAGLVLVSVGTRTRKEEHS